jgi:uncharacterized protein
MADLYERLREIRRTRKTDTGADQGFQIRDTSPGTGWARLGAGVYHRVRSLDLSPQAGNVRSGGVWCDLSPVLRCGESVFPVFLDVETSGLSGGAGSVAFLVGLGTLGRGCGDDAVFDARRVSIAVEQFFLSDLAAEPEFVRLLHQRIDRINSEVSRMGRYPVTYVTYNGASFDLPVLRSRAIMVRRVFPENDHLDLLPVTRRLYARRIGSCSLSAVERRVLSVHRENDIPGFEVPQRYLDFLRNGALPQLQPVLDHHYHDIANLAILAMNLNGVLSDPERALVQPEESLDPGYMQPDVPGLLRLLVERGGPAERTRAEQLLLRRVRESDPRYGSRIPPEEWRQLALLQMRVARRSGSWKTLLEVLQALYEVNATPDVAVDLAKQLEHKYRDYAGALRVVNEAGQRWGWTATLSHRAQRLNRRISRSRDRSARTAEPSDPS